MAFTDISPIPRHTPLSVLEDSYTKVGA